MCRVWHLTLTGSTASTVPSLAALRARFSPTFARAWPVTVARARPGATAAMPLLPPSTAATTVCTCPCVGHCRGSCRRRVCLCFLLVELVRRRERKQMWAAACLSLTCFCVGVVLCRGPTWTLAGTALRVRRCLCPLGQATTPRESLVPAVPGCSAALVSTAPVTASRTTAPLGTLSTESLLQSLNVGLGALVQGLFLFVAAPAAAVWSLPHPVHTFGCLSECMETLRGRALPTAPASAWTGCCATRTARLRWASRVPLVSCRWCCDLHA